MLLVIDTNIFVHTNNPEVDYCDSCKTCLDSISTKEIFLIVDEGFDRDESKNKSMIGSEYFAHIKYGTLGFNYLLTLINDDRFRPIAKKTFTKHKKKFLKYVKDSVDRIFVTITFASKANALVSNDFDDFNGFVRSDLDNEFGINILSSKEASDNIVSTQN